MNDKIFLEAHIADIHFGAMDPAVQYNILQEQFISKISKLKLDIISINGDLFDHKFMSNSDVIMYAMKFVDDLVKICKINGTTLILIHGTNYHDAGQLKLFYNYIADPDIDIRIIESVRLENVKGKRILCIPEMYGMGEDYYRKYTYYSGFYDSVYMHGCFKNAIYGHNEEDLNSNREPTFSIETFNNCGGPIISGHVHVAGCFNNDFYYSGSPYRWCYGEEQPKGFIILTHNITTRQYYVHFEEIQSFRYDTINLDNMLQSDPKDVINHIKDLQEHGVDNVRIEFTQENDSIELIKNFYKNNNNVILKYDAKGKKEKQEELKLKEKYIEYDYLLDKNLSEYEILSRYINQNLGYAYISSDDLVQLLKD